MNKKHLNETETCQNHITPVIADARRNPHAQIRREFSFTAGRIIVPGTPARREMQQRAEYLIFHQSKVPITFVEAKDTSRSVGRGGQQGIDNKENDERAARISYIYGFRQVRQ